MSLELHKLSPAKGSVKTSTRKGRGQGSGKGGTAARGHKGAKSRSGYSRKIGFEGGQMPLQRRVPKFGFKNINRVEYFGINIDSIQKLINEGKISTNITPETLLNAGAVKKNMPLKILGRGEITSKISLSAHKFSKTAVSAIESAGGTISIISSIITSNKEEE